MGLPSVRRGTAAAVRAARPSRRLHFFQPGPAAAGYGVPAGPGGGAGAHLTIKALRDDHPRPGGSGAAGLRRGRAEAWFVLAVALVPLGDMLIVLRHGGTKAVAFGIHFATAVVVLISAGLLFAVRARPHRPQGVGRCRCSFRSSTSP
ncbi:DUF4267 domain-containing protein [Streptomyces sp. Li-HN-5-11]|uniref:DUF4267 domain-containing protein n=1 Tax=Streptomyces sp. Li-HN-5-11 TaxID=3075432 RepID=UPI0037D9A61E